MMLSLLLTASAGSLDGLPSLVGPGEDQPIVRLIPAADLDGDGLGDLIAAVPADDAAGHEAGAIYVVLDVAALQPLTPVAEVGIQLTGEQSQGYAGFSVAVLGDTDGDGLPDLAVGAPEADGVDPSGGRVYLVMASALAAGSLGEHPVILGAESWTRAGTRLFAPGDVDEDGRSDLLIGAPYPTPEGDPDIGWLALVLAPGDGGWPDETILRVDYQGSEGSTLAGADAAWVVPEAGSLFGRAAARVHDENGDGRDELLIGAPGTGGHQHIAPPDAGSGGSTAHSVGSVLLFNLPTPAELNRPLIRTDSEAVNTLAGSRQEALPWEILVLADGRLVLSATEGNAVYVFDEVMGRALSSDAEVTLTSTDGSMIGWGLADVTGLNGEVVLALSEPGYDSGTGRVLLLDPTLDGLASQLAAATLDSCIPDSQAGYGLASSLGPDATGAMRPMLGITAPEASIYAEGDGVATLLTADHLAAFDAACPPIDALPTDLDGDGFSADDCDDAVPWRYPGAVEICGDGIDDDCDGSADEDCGPAEPKGCSSAPGAGLALTLLALAALSRRRALLFLLPSAAAAADFPVDGAPLAKILGSAEYERLHGPVFSADLDNSGAAELIVANYQGTSGEHSSGEVMLLQYEDLIGAVDLEGSSPTFTGHEEHDYFGVDAVALPLMLVVGADNSGLTERDPGNVAVFVQPTQYAGNVDMEEADIYFQGDSNADAFGREVESGDLDGDGVADLALAAPMRDQGEALSRGSVWVLPGPIDGYAGQLRIDTVATELAGSGPDAWYGWRLRIPGDIDGDGAADLVVGELGAGPNFGGRLWVMLGGPGGPITTAGAWEAPTAGDRIGAGLDGGDIDGDSAAEVLVGSPLYGRGAGRVWLLSGAPAGIDDIDAEAIAIRDGYAGENLGASVAIGPAILVGAPRGDRVYALDSSLGDIATLTGDGNFGSFVNWLDDLDEDATMDVFATSPERGETRVGQGVGWVVSGQALLDGKLPSSSGMDADADGVASALDCDDADPRRSPEALEVCRDGVDNDCDWVADEDDCVRGGCSTAGAGPWLFGALTLLFRRRSLGALALVLVGCKAPPLDLSVPAGTLAGEVPLSLAGNYEQLILEVDGIVLAGGAGPALSASWDTTTTDDGQHTVTGKGLNGRDDPEEVFVTVTVDQLAGDTTPPTIEFVNPLDGSTLPSGVLSDGATVELNVADNAALASVSVSADGALLGSLPAEGPYELLWTPSTAGEHTLSAEAADAAGNTATATVSVTVEEGSGMECNITSPRDGATVSGTVEIRAALASPDGVSGAEFYADNQLIGTDAASPWAASWDSAGIEGEVTLLVIATDRAGAVCEDEITVTASGGSGDPFEVVISNPQDGGTVFGASVPVRVAAGGGGGPERVDLYIGGSLSGSDATSPFEFSFDSTPFANGSLEIRALGEERGTGATSEHLISVTVDN